MSWGDDNDKLMKYSDDFLRDLAGNAFHSGCCAAVTLSIACTFGLAIKRSHGSKIHAIRKIKLFEGAALIDDGGGSDDDLDALWS